MSLPVIKKQSASSNSLIEFVIAPEPKVAARPATVDAWQSLAQWSTLLVLNTARASFIIRKFSSFVVFAELKNARASGPLSVLIAENFSANK